MTTLDIEPTDSVVIFNSLRTGFDNEQVILIMQLEVDFDVGLWEYSIFFLNGIY